MLATAAFALMVTATAAQPAEAVLGMKPADVPEAPRLALERAASNHPLVVVVQRSLRGKILSYETTVTIGTVPWFIKVNPEGKLLEKREVKRPSPRPSPRPKPAT